MMKEKTSRQKKEKRKGLSFFAKLLILTMTPILVVSTVLVVCGSYFIESGERDEIYDGLKSTAISVTASYNHVGSGDYTLKEDGSLYKGDVKLDSYIVDELFVNTQLYSTVFYGDTRIITSVKDSAGNRMTGTKAGAEVVAEVLQKGNDYFNKNVNINGENYYGYYHPIKNSDNKVVGMIFVGKKSADAENRMIANVAKMLVISIVFCIIMMIVVIIRSKIIVTVLNKVKSILETIANGDFTTEIDFGILKNSDEIGDMARAVSNVQEHLRDSMTEIKNAVDVLTDSSKKLEEASTQTRATTDEVTHAIEEISNGAMSQADDTQSASENVGIIGQKIESVIVSAGNLKNAAGTMKRAEEASTQIIQELHVSNDNTIEAFQKIENQILATNNSAQMIRQAVDVISNIAEETSLLSLNANIEAARAGEQGKGFAVVATQIQKLAEQSSNSAQSIAAIIAELLEDSENTVNVMGEVKEIVSQQKIKLDETKNKFDEVSDGINTSMTGISEINNGMTGLDEARRKIIDIISSLSAISQENAASTEETMAATEELNATVTSLAESATLLDELADKIYDEINKFKLA